MADVPATQHFLSPEGEVVEVPADQVARMAAAPDWTPATPRQAADFELQKKYGTPWQQVATGAEAAAQALTFGGSTFLEKWAGVEPEGIQARPRANPLAGPVGTAIGIAAPLLLTGGAAAAAKGAGAAVGAAEGASALGRVAEFSAPSLAARAGRAVTAGVEGLLPESTSLMGQLGAKALAGGAGAAAEGALYGVGNVVHEAALGDPELTAQSALAEVGLSAVLTGGLGALGHAGGFGLTKALEKAREATDGLLPGLRAAFPTSERLATAVGRQYEAVEGALHRANAEFRPAEVDALADHAAQGLRPDVVRGAYLDVVQKVGEAADSMRAKPDLFPARFAARLDGGVRDLLEAKAALEKPAEAFRQLNKFKQALDGVIQFDKLPSEANMEALDALKGLRSNIRNVLEDEAVFGKAGARQAAFNEAQAEYISARKDFEKAFTSKVSQPGGPVRRVNPASLERLAADESPKGAMRREAFERYQRASRSMLDEIEQSAAHAPTGAFDRKAIAGLVDESGDMLAGARRSANLARMAEQLHGGLAMGVAAGHMLGGPLGAAVGAGLHVLATAAKHVPRGVEVMSKLASGNGAVAGHVERALTALANGAAYAGPAIKGVALAAPAEHAAAARARAANPEEILENLSLRTMTLHAHAPATAQALQTTVARGLAFLASVAPAPRRAGPLGQEMPPNAADLYNYSQAVEIVEKPLALLRHLHMGTLTKMHLRAMAVVHPKLLGLMRQTALGVVGGHRRVPYASRLALGALLGQDLDGTATTMAIRASLGAYASPSGKQDTLGGAGGKSGAGAGKVTLGERSRTPMERAANRE